MRARHLSCYPNTLSRWALVHGFTREPDAGTFRLLMTLPFVLGLVGWAEVRSALAHEGPPFPILMDRPAAGYVVSVWADPDIGEAQFFVVVESPAGGPPRDVPQVSMWAEPVSGRLKRAVYKAERQTLRNQLQFEARPYFDQRDMWIVGFRLTTPSGKSHELTTEVESTPPGYGLWDLAIYLFPFALLGGMWMIAMARRRRMRQMQASIAASHLVEAPIPQSQNSS